MSNPDVPEGFDDPTTPVEPPAEPPAEPLEPREPEPAPTPQPEAPRPAQEQQEPAPEPEPEPEEEPKAEPEKPKTFPDEHKRTFEGLLHLGKLTEHVDAYGHDVVIQTLTMEQMMLAGLIHQRFRSTLGETRAWQAAILSAAIVSVDGKSLPIPVADVSTETLMRDRFEYISKHWYPPTVDVIYSAYLELEGQVEEVLNALGGASG